jgi:Flp pilus assembly protein TadG
LKRPAIHFGPRAGQALILVVVAAGIFMFGALGLAIDVGQMYAQQQMAQAAADAAASAGILSIMKGTNATSTYTFGTGTPPLASYVCTTSDGRTPCVYARDNGFGATASDTVTLSYPATVSGATLASVTVPAFTVTVQRILNNGLIRFVGGPAHSTISAKATAGITGTAAKYCLIALSSAATPYAFAATSGATVTASGCGIAVNSSYSPDAAQILSSTVSASVIDIVGTFYKDNGSTVTPWPTNHIASPGVADPLASLSAPTIASCAAHPSQTTPASNTTLTPGTYCGGIYVGNGVNNITFSPGIYVMNGGGISLNQATVTANGVMFYLTGTSSTYSSVYMGNNLNATLSAPTSGTYQGILFFADRSIVSTYSNGAAITNGISVNMSGTLYFPTTSVSFSSGASSSSYMAIVADTISFSSGAKIKSDPTGLYTGLSRQSVALVQ